MVAIIALLALALQPAIVPQHRLRGMTARLGASPALQLDGRGTSPVRRPLGKKTSSRTIYIDGNNLMMQRKVTKGREQLAARLAGISGAEVVIVFDGRAGERSPRACMCHCLNGRLSAFPPASAGAPGRACGVGAVPCPASLSAGMPLPSLAFPLDL
jgi:hypothetical protein